MARPSCIESSSRFYVIGDVPYSTSESIELEQQILSLPSDAEFLIHVGDIRSARDGRKCEIDEYHEVAEILKLSNVPVFIVLGGKRAVVIFPRHSLLLIQFNRVLNCR